MRALPHNVQQNKEVANSIKYDSVRHLGAAVRVEGCGTSRTRSTLIKSKNACGLGAAPILFCIVVRRYVQLI